jgi:hypothetical protein
MERRTWIGLCLFLGLYVHPYPIAERVVAGEPLPDDTFVAYKESKPAKQPPQPKPSPIYLSGAIQSVQADGLKIKGGKTSDAKNQQEWLVYAQSESTSFTIRGTATPDYLRKGQTVEFSGQLATNEQADSKGDKNVAEERGAVKAIEPKVTEEKIVDKVAALTVFSRKVGAVKKSSTTDHVSKTPRRGSRSESSKAAKDSQTTSAAPTESTAKAETTAKAVETPTFVTKATGPGAKSKIVGRIESSDGKSFTVTAGHQKIHAELADAPTINVELSDPTFVSDSKGGSNNMVEGTGPSGKLVSMLASELVNAKIVVRGMGLETSSDKRCAAKSIVITLATPLTGAKPTTTETKKLADQK